MKGLRTKFASAASRLPEKFRRAARLLLELVSPAVVIFLLIGFLLLVTVVLVLTSLMQLALWLGYMATRPISRLLRWMRTGA
jgi:type II secretory pathway component PulF